MSNCSQMDCMKMNQVSVNKMDHPMNMKNMEMKLTSKYTKFWEGVVADTLHCGAGCSSADLVVMGALAIAHISIGTWLKFTAKLMLLLFLISIAFMVVMTFI